MLIFELKNGFRNDNEKKGGNIKHGDPMLKKKNKKERKINCIREVFYFFFSKKGKNNSIFIIK